MADSTDTAAPFGSVLADVMAVSRTEAGAFAGFDVQPTAAFKLSPATHALQYGSQCFEGLKAHRGTDGAVRMFRAPDHAARMQASAAALCLPVPGRELFLDMVRAAAQANADQVPEPPGALYLRPTLIGSDANIGAAAAPSAEALFYVVASPVGSYFAGGERPLTVHVERSVPRSTPQFGQVKTGANYAMALATIVQARAEGADQVLFAPGGDVQETGASNFIVLDDDRLVTKQLDGSFLPGITRDSVLALARDLGYAVEERDIEVGELIHLVADGEAALTGTAAVLSGVGTLVHDGERICVGTGEVGPNTRRLRDRLVAVQRGQAPDRWGWTEVVTQRELSAAPSDR